MDHQTPSWPAGCALVSTLGHDLPWRIHASKSPRQRRMMAEEAQYLPQLRTGWWCLRIWIAPGITAANPEVLVMTGITVLHDGGAALRHAALVLHDDLTVLRFVYRCGLAAEALVVVRAVPRIGPSNDARVRSVCGPPVWPVGSCVS